MSMADYTPFPLTPWYERPDVAAPGKSHKVMSAGPNGSGGVSSEMLSVEQILNQIDADDIKPFADPRSARSSKAIDYTATINDNRKTIAFTAAGKTLTLPRAAFALAASEAFEFSVSAEAGAVTIVRSGTETILGVTSIVLNQGETATFFLDSAGVGWRAAISPPYGTVARTDAANAFTKRQHLAKGSTIASASAIALPSDGNFFDVSGTSPVSAISTVTQAGTCIKLRATGAFTLQHNAASLILPRAQNIALAAGDIVEFISLGGGAYVLSGIARADGTALAGGPQPFVSSPQTFTFGASVAVAHGLGGPPGNVALELVCATADRGYAVGNIIHYAPWAAILPNVGHYGIGIEKDATNVILRIAGNGVSIYDKAGGGGWVSITPGSWRLVVRAWP